MYHWVLKTRVYLGLRTCKVFLWFVAIVRVRIYDIDFFVFIVLLHRWVLQVLTPRMSPKLRQRPHFAAEIWKRYISKVRPTVHTNPSRKRSLKPEEFENTGFAFYAFSNGDFQKQWRLDDYMISLIEFYSNANRKWPVIAVFFNSSFVVWMEPKNRHVW